MEKLKNLGTILTGNTPTTSDINNYSSDDICFVKPSDISGNGLTRLSTSEFYISEYARKKARILPVNSVLVTCIGIIGKVALNSVECSFNQQINAIIPDKNKCVPEYLAYAIIKKSSQLRATANSAVVPIINKAQFSEIAIPVPPPEKQKQIVKVLEKIERMISLYEKQLCVLDDLIKARFVEMFGDPVANTKGWRMAFIEDVVSKEKNALKAGPFGSALKKEYFVESGYKIYGQEQVISGDPDYGDYYIDEERYRQLENCAVQAGDVLISLVGTYGKLLIMPECFEPGIINPRLMKITFDKEKVNPYYFQHYFQSDSLKRSLADNTHGGTMDILNLGIVRKLKMPLPPIELQNEFVAFVAQVDKSKFAVQKALYEAQTLFDSLMQKYFG